MAKKGIKRSKGTPPKISLFIEAERQRRKIPKTEMAAAMKISVDTYRRRLGEEGGFYESEFTAGLNLFSMAPQITFCK